MNQKLEYLLTTVSSCFDQVDKFFQPCNPSIGQIKLIRSSKSDKVRKAAEKTTILGGLVGWWAAGRPAGEIDNKTNSAQLSWSWG